MYSPRFLKYVLIFLVFISTTSCFEIIEEVDIKSDGTGQMVFTLNMSKSKTKLASIMLMDSINGYKVPSRKDIQDGLNDVVENLSMTEGISNIKKTADYENFVFSVSCDFKKIENINSLIDGVSKKQKTPTALSSYFFDNKTANFKRTYSYSSELKRQYNKLKTENKKVFDDASYTIIYRFDKEVLSQTNAAAKLSKSRKAIMHRMDAMSLINGQANVANTIQLNK